ncbi:50S ribosomal L21, chloroplastic [Olea europaea subsp. europaea]|uniref:50S ribosomal L21, chloroplastic n=1 Tax=Olea europaea subsp. europaea TaxID=158383 RepID=A0A8S0S6N7_OLEEU|nr:50S ribosomal L21, chloroplastic [Olea europaea subsp. europaea]
MASLSPCSSLTTASMLSRKQKFSVPSLKTNLNFLSRSISSVRLDSPKQPFFVPKFSQTDAPSLAEPEIEPTTEIEAITEVQPTVETSEAETKREEVFAVVMVGSRQYIVFPGRFIYTQRLKGANVNDKVSLSDEKLKNLNLICSLSYLCLPSVYVIILVSSFTCVLLVFQVSFYLMFGQYSSG